MLFFVCLVLLDFDYFGIDYEVVVGEQCYCVIGVLNWIQILVYICDLMDQQVLEIQVIENLKCKDLYLLEEVEGFDQLMKEYGYIVDMLVEKVKYSKLIIYVSLKLFVLLLDVCKVFYEGKIIQLFVFFIVCILSSKF